LVVLLLAAACGIEPSTPDGAAAGRLASQPGAVTATPESPGLHEVDVGSSRPALLYVPTTYRPDAASPVLVLLHGAGGDARGGIDPLLASADEASVILIAPSSRRATWDVIGGEFGPDVTATDRALEHVFGRFSVDGTRLGIGGFSDGASYALSVGLTNGDLFTHVVAFSPGFSAEGEAVGRPRIFITHGVDDRVLPIDRTSRRLQPRLWDAGYDVVYEEFAGGHVVPADKARRALDWFLQ
jgi:predicted esterase